MKRIFLWPGATATLALIIQGTSLIGQQPAGAPATQNAAGPVRSVFIRILPHGMEPVTLTVQPGPLTIIVQNTSTAPNVKLELDQVNGGHLKTIPMHSGQHHSVDNYNLTPGEYVLSEDYHSGWHCKITVK